MGEKVGVFKTIKGLLAIPDKEGSSYEDARAVVVPFGLEASVSYGHGTSRGPEAMIKASYQVELFDEDLWREPVWEIGIATLKKFPVKKKIEAALKDLEAVTERILGDRKFPLIFGGEHSITAGAIRPFAGRYPDPLLVHFDEHADLADGYEGERYSHAAP